MYWPRFGLFQMLRGGPDGPTPPPKSPIGRLNWSGLSASPPALGPFLWHSRRGIRTLCLELTLRLDLGIVGCAETQSAAELSGPSPLPRLGPFLCLEPVGGWRIIEACRSLPLGTQYGPAPSSCAASAHPRLGPFLLTAPVKERKRPPTEAGLAASSEPDQLNVAGRPRIAVLC